MECPKCGKEVSNDAKVCPHCKKVLKLVCPKCETTNPTPVCKKCGFDILSKCEKCGTITPTIKGKCSKCGFSTYTSVAMAASNIEQFACLTIDFPNLDELKDVLGSKRLIEKFNANLDSMIVDFCNNHELKREIIDGTYVLKFNKNDFFNESAIEAINAAIDISKSIIFMNFKLAKTKAFSIECKMCVLKRDINTLPENFKSGFDIKLVSNYPKELKYLNYFQIFTDSHIYQEVSDTFNLNSLSSSYINGEMVTFFELNLKKHLKVEEPKEEEEENPVNLTQLEEIKETLIDEYEEIENKLYNTNTITFNDMKCSFMSSNAYDVGKIIIDEITQKKKQILILKSTQNFKPESDKIISSLKNKNLASNVFKISCSEILKFEPYGFFNELIKVANNYARSPKLLSSNKFSTLSVLDHDGLLNSIINLVENNSTKIEESKDLMHDIFTKIIKSLGKIIIYINNFELIDDASYELLKDIWKQIPDNLIFISEIDIDCSFHKTLHFLFQSEKYTEIRLKPLSVKHILESENKRLSAFSNTYYFTNILQSIKGSYFFFNMALAYLNEKNIISEDKDGISVLSTNSCVIPTSAELLMNKRLQCLIKENDSFKLLAMITLNSQMTDLKTLQLLEFPNLTEVLKELCEYDYISIHENNVYVKNYELTLKSFHKILKEEEKIEFAKEILEKVYSKSFKTIEELNLYRIIGDTKSEQKTLEFLSSLNAKTGDLSAYIKCTLRLTKLMEKNLKDENKDEIMETFKNNIHENVSKLLNKYTPRKIYSVSKNILSNLEKTDDLPKLVAFGIKMINTSMLCGNFAYTLDLINKILAKLNQSSNNPEEVNYNPSYLLIILIRIQALFSIGRLKECEELGCEIISFLKSPKLYNALPEEMQKNEFEETITTSMTFVVLSKVFLLRKDESIKALIDELKVINPNLPSHFDYLPLIKDTMLGKEVSTNLDSKNDEKFTKIIKATLRAFVNDKEDNTKFANDIYEAKICANINDYPQLEVLFDLLIGYTYFKLGAIEKAKAIYYNVIELSEVNGLKLVSYISCYLLSMLYYKLEETDTALGLANNTVSHIEKDNNVGDYLFYLFRVLTSGIYMDLGDEDKALACTQSAVFVKKKDNVVFGLENVDIEAVERRVNDRRKVKEDFGGRRKGQRRITDDMALIENLPEQNKQNQSQEDLKLLKDMPKENVKKHTMIDDMKMIENMPNNKSSEQKISQEDFKLLNEKSEKDNPKKENDIKPAATIANKLKQEKDELRKKQEEEKAFLGDLKHEFRG